MTTNSMYAQASKHVSYSSYSPYPSTSLTSISASFFAFAFAIISFLGLGRIIIAL